MTLIDTAIKLLTETGRLPRAYFPHRLKGKRKGEWGCHIQSDWLMTWIQNDKELTLTFTQTGRHRNMFDK